MRLLFYWGPGDLVTKAIRMMTAGPYSHVELEFANGCRFFSTGHGLYRGVHLHCGDADDHSYNRWWRALNIPASPREEALAQAFAFTLIGVPFDWRGLFSFLLPFVDRRRQGQYCSSIILEVLQRSLHLYPGVQLKISPNGLYRLVLMRVGGPGGGT